MESLRRGTDQRQAGQFTDTARGDCTSSDVRYTARDETLYAILMAPPTNGRVVLSSFAPGAGLFDGSISSVRLVGRNSELDWSQGSNGLEVSFPQRPVDAGPFAVKIERSA
jgi:alpha-L-fucosidase